MTAMLAQLDLLPTPAPPTGTVRQIPGLGQDLLTVVLIGVGVMVVLGLGILFFRRYWRRRHHHRHRSHAGMSTSHTEAGANVASLHRRRRRRMRREHRQHNPTLAETGGLPPPRPEGQLPPSL